VLAIVFSLLELMGLSCRSLAILLAAFLTTAASDGVLYDGGACSNPAPDALMVHLSPNGSDITGNGTKVESLAKKSFAKDHNSGIFTFCFFKDHPYLTAMRAFDQANVQQRSEISLYLAPGSQNGSLLSFIDCTHCHV